MSELIESQRAHQPLNEHEGFIHSNKDRLQLFQDALGWEDVLREKNIKREAGVLDTARPEMRPGGLAAITSEHWTLPGFKRCRR